MLDSLDTLIAFALIFTVVSLLITIVVQLISSLLNLRGMNLAWGITEAFEAIAPQLGENLQQAATTVKDKFFPATTSAKKLADHCLNDTLISDAQFLGFKGMASAVRGDELFDLLQRIATGKRGAGADDVQAHAVALFQALGVPSSVFQLTPQDRAALTAMQQDLKKALAAVPAGTTSPLIKKMQEMEAEAQAKLAGTAVNVEHAALRWAALGEAKIQDVYQKFNQLFNTGQQRAQEWFTTHTRILTAILGLLFAIGLQLDTIEVFKTVSSNRELRAKLVAQVKTVTDQGEKILNIEPVAAPAAPAAGAGNKGKNLPTPTADAHEKQVHAILDNLRTVRNDMDKTGFELFPPTFMGRWPTKDWEDNEGSHLLGILFSAFLLSLGAPFWFNTLKGLASLRSAVANNIDDEKEAKVKAGAANKPGMPPPTVTPPSTTK